MRRQTNNFRVLDNFVHFTPGVGQILMLCLWFLVGVLLGNAATLVSGLFTSDMSVVMLVSYPLMFIPAMMYASVRSHQDEGFKKGYSLDCSNFKPLGGWLCILFAALGTWSLNYVSEYFVTCLPPMPDALKAALDSMTGGNFAVNFICAAIFAPFFEEWLCRGMILRGLLHYRTSGGKQVRPVWAIVISAVFFAVIHFNPWQAIVAFLLGVFFGYVYYRTGSLKLTMLMHLINNTSALVINRIPAFEGMESWRDVIKGSDYWIVYVCCLLLAALAVYEFNRIKPLSPEGSFEEHKALFDE